MRDRILPRLRRLLEGRDGETMFLALAVDHADLARRERLIDRRRALLGFMLSNRVPTPS
jgi:hypothetical protein